MIYRWMCNDYGASWVCRWYMDGCVTPGIYCERLYESQERVMRGVCEVCVCVCLGLCVRVMHACEISCELRQIYIQPVKRQHVSEWLLLWCCQHFAFPWHGRRHAATATWQMLLSNSGVCSMSGRLNCRLLFRIWPAYPSTGTHVSLW